MQTIDYKIKGLDCVEESILLEKIVGKAPGVISLHCSHIHSKMTVVYDPSLITDEKIVLLVKSTGLKAYAWDKPLQENRGGPTVSTFLSGFLLLLGLSCHFFSLFTAAKILELMAIVAGIFYIVPKAYFSLRHLRADMHLLMVLAIGGAILIQDFAEGASVAFLFSLSVLLEKWSVRRAEKAIESLFSLVPSLATKIVEGKLEESEVSNVEIGDILLVRPGAKVPLDGIVIKGSSSIDESFLTGESMPVNKSLHDEVFAGTMNGEGALEFKVTKRQENTLLARMVSLVESAKNQKSKAELWVEKFARVYTPLMLAIAILLMLIPPLLFSLNFQTWIYTGLVFLLIACPCALVIATPVSILSSLTAASRNGILIKGGIFLEQIGKIKAMAIDKTGTLTYGKPSLQQIVPFYNHTKEEVLERAAAMEKASSHPFARAILDYAKKEKIPFGEVDHFKSLTGKGSEAIYKGSSFWIGSHLLMHEKGQETQSIHEKALELEDAGHSLVAIGNDLHVCGLISFADSPRAGIFETINAIKKLGIKKIVMLTGDNEKTAMTLAKHCGIDFFRAGLLPEDKLQAVAALKVDFDLVAMVGDGINDAPSLAAASIGIAMAGMGSDIAIQAADIALLTDDLAKVPWLISHSRKTLRIIYQNVAFALGVKGIFILLALFHMTTLWMAIGVDTGSTFLVICNALRLLKSKSSLVTEH